MCANTAYKGFIRGKRLELFLVNRGSLLVRVNFLIKILIFKYNKIYFIYILKAL